MYKIIFAVVFLIALSVGGVSAEPDTTNPTGITVTGTAHTTGQPDIAYVTVGFTNVDPDAARAAQENANTTTAVINAIVKAGIPKKDIQTQNYSVAPEMNYQKTPAVLVGYRVTNSVRAKVRDIKLIGPVIDAATAAGANEVQGINFAIENDAALRQQALVMAVKDAEAKARVMAGALGVKLGRAISAAESSGVSPRPMVSFGAAKAGAAAPTPIQPGELEVTANVTVTYAIM